MRTHPPIDPEVAAALIAADLPSPSLLPGDIPAARIRSLATAPDEQQLRRGGTITVTDLDIPGPDGNPTIPALLLAAARAGETSCAATEYSRHTTSTPQRPGILFVHGGGMIVGGRHHIDDAMLDAAELGYLVISPDYRLAPEHPYPAAVDDCYAAWCWVAAHAAELGVDPGALSIAGSSAGGGLAAGTTLLARDRGGPMPRHQLLFCPMLDDREITASSRELVGEGRWDRVANRTGWSAYLGDRRGGDDVPVYAAPARAIDLTGLPPTFIDVGDVETFRDEDIDYAARLSRAGVPVELHVWPGGVHGFASLAPDAAISRGERAARRSYLERAIGAGRATGG